MFYDLYYKNTFNKIRDHRFLTPLNTQPPLIARYMFYPLSHVFPSPLSLPPCSVCNLLAPPAWTSEPLFCLDDFKFSLKFYSYKYADDAKSLVEPGLLSSNLFIQQISKLQHFTNTTNWKCLRRTLSLSPKCIS